MPVIICAIICGPMLQPYAIIVVRILQISFGVRSFRFAAGKKALVKCRSLSTSINKSGSFIVRICPESQATSASSFCFFAGVNFSVGSFESFHPSFPTLANMLFFSRCKKYSNALLSLLSKYKGTSFGFCGSLFFLKNVSLIASHWPVLMKKSSSFPNRLLPVIAMLPHLMWSRSAVKTAASYLLRLISPSSLTACLTAFGRKSKLVLLGTLRLVSCSISRTIWRAFTNESLPVGASSRLNISRSGFASCRIWLNLSATTLRLWLYLLVRRSSTSSICACRCVWGYFLNNASISAVPSATASNSPHNFLWLVRQERVVALFDLL